MGYDELQSAGKQTSFDVHTHNLGFEINPDDNTSYKIGDPNPSGTPGAPGYDYGYRTAKENNNEVNSPSWVIGTKADVVPGADGKPIATNKTKVITFYNSGGAVKQTDWNRFKKTVNNIRKK